MKRYNVMLSRSALALAVAIGSTTPTLARVCEGVMFSYTNGTDGPIRVTGVRYRDLNSGNPRAWRVENVNNDQCASDAPCNTGRDDLGSITRPRENHDLTDIQFRYQRMDDEGNWLDNDWDERQSATYVPANMRCTDRRTYGPFAIPQ